MKTMTSYRVPCTIIGIILFILLVFFTSQVWADEFTPIGCSSCVCEAQLSFRKGEVAAKAKQWNSAITAYSSAIQKDPACVAARVRKGQALAETGRLEKALATLTVAVFTTPGSYDAVFQRGRVCIRLENYPQALRDMNTALRLAPDSAEAHYWRAWTLLKLGKVKAAFKDFDAAHRINSKFPKPKLVYDDPEAVPTRGA